MSVEYTLRKVLSVAITARYRQPRDCYDDLAEALDSIIDVLAPDAVREIDEDPVKAYARLCI